LRFAVSGHAPKAAQVLQEVQAPEEVKEPAVETKAPTSETAEPIDATNNQTKVEAATGN
jgi:two-component system, NtrC family, nitrogen regulation sensor histidine kinase NtrY